MSLQRKRTYPLGSIPVLLKKIVWINIDRFVKETEKRSYTVQIFQNSFSHLDSYIIYENLNSFVSGYHWDNKVSFTDITVKEGETYVLIAACKNELLYATKIRLRKKENLKVTLENRKNKD